MGCQVTINTQGSSHWDGLRHYPYQDSKLYYNGVTQEDITGPLKNDRLGIQSKQQQRSSFFFFSESSPSTINV